ncbi:unnamed protein product [Mytilus coruscus]|uniref:Uncharacterized protein n=1 Tax=Mytilus coruscus TaxID=42192 RepID=A0A6J8EZ62_MYTCO|nr:unnamed protein product [Mytilus coruscus]
MLKASVSKLHERVQAFAEVQRDLQQKLQQTHATKHRAEPEENKDNNYPDTARTSNSEWYALSHIEEPPRPRLKPFFTPSKERHETTRAKLSGSTNHKAAESLNPLLLNEPIKSVSIEIPDRKHSDSTIEYFLISVGRFQRFRKWFKQLCCCCSQDAEDSVTVCS